MKLRLPREEGQGLVIMALALVGLVFFLITILHIFQLAITVNSMREGLLIAANSGVGMIGKGDTHELKSEPQIEAMVREVAARNLAEHQGTIASLTAQAIIQDTSRTQVQVFLGPGCTEDLTSSARPTYCGPFVSMSTTVPIRLLAWNQVVNLPLHVTSASATTASGTPQPVSGTPIPPSNFATPGPTPTP